MALPNSPLAGTQGPFTLRSRTFLIFVLVFGLGVAGWGPTLSFLSVFVRDELGGSILSAAFIFLAIHSVASTLGLTSGLWITRFGSKATYALGMVGMLAFVTALAVAPDYRWIIGLGPFLGVFLSFHWTGLQSYVIEVTPVAMRGLGSGIVTFIMVFAPGVSGPLLGALSERFGFRWLGYGALVLIGSALVLMLIALPNLHRPSAGRRSAGGLRLRAYAGLLKSGPVSWSLVVRASTSMSFGVFTLLAGPKLVDAGGGLQSVGLFVAVGAVGGGLAQVLMGRLSDAIGRRALLGASVILGIFSAVLFGMAHAIPVLLVASTVQWFSQSAFQTLLLAVGGDVAPPGEMGRVMALQTSSFSWGMVGGALAAGFLVGVDPSAPFIAAAAVQVLGLVGAVMLPGREPRPPTPRDEPAAPARARTGG